MLTIEHKDRHFNEYKPSQTKPNKTKRIEQLNHAFKWSVFSWKLPHTHTQTYAATVGCMLYLLVCSLISLQKLIEYIIFLCHSWAHSHGLKMLLVRKRRQAQKYMLMVFFSLWFAFISNDHYVYAADCVPMMSVWLATD